MKDRKIIQESSSRNLTAPRVTAPGPCTEDPPITAGGLFAKVPCATALLVRAKAPRATAMALFGKARHTTASAISAAVLLLFVALPDLHAQGIHFSQFYNSPMTLNPALSPVMPAECRATGNYRNQWTTLIKGFSTLSGSIEKKFTFPTSTFSLSAMIVSDQHGLVKMNTMQVFGAIGFSKQWEKSSLGIAIQPGLVQNKVDIGNLVTFPSQYDNTTGIFSTEQPGESFSQPKHPFFDVNFGLVWTGSLNEQIDFLGGYAVDHLAFPKASFSPQPSEEANVPLNHSIFLTGRIPTSMRLNLNPSVLFSYSAGARNLTFGASGYLLQRSPEQMLSAINFGIYHRLLDAVILTGGFSYTEYTLGFSYDINVSGLRRGTSTLGALEVSVMFDCSFDPALPEKLIPCYRF